MQAIPGPRERPWVCDLVPAILDGADEPWLPEPARDASTVVLLVLDGLGWCDLVEHRARLPTTASLQGGPISTVVPSTTAVALTSITTGLVPLQHGIVGYRMRVRGRRAEYPSMAADEPATRAGSGAAAAVAAVPRV